MRFSPLSLTVLLRNPRPGRPNAGFCFPASDETHRRRSTRRARESTASNASASSYHGFNTRSAAPSTLSGPGTVSSTNAKVVRKEKWQGGYYAYVEEDWDPAIDGAGVGTGLGTGRSLAASSQPANVRLSLLLFLSSVVHLLENDTPSPRRLAAARHPEFPSNPMKSLPVGRPYSHPITLPHARLSSLFSFLFRLHLSCSVCLLSSSSVAVSIS